MPCASLSRYSSVSIRASSSGLLKNPISIKIVGTSAKLNPVKSERCTIPLFLRQPQPDCKVQLFLGLISAGSTADKGFFGRVAVWRNRLLHTLTGHFMSGINADDFLRKRQNRFWLFCFGGNMIRRRIIDFNFCRLLRFLRLLLSQRLPITASAYTQECKQHTN